MLSSNTDGDSGDLQEDAEIVGGSPPPAGHDHWLNGPRTVVEGVEKRKFIGDDFVDLESPVVRNLLARVKVGGSSAPQEDEDEDEALSILPDAPTASSKDPFVFMPTLH